MANLEEIAEIPREDGVDEAVRSTRNGQSTHTAGDAERERENASDPEDSGKGSPQGQDRRNLNVDGGGEQIGQPAVGQKKVLPPIVEDVRGKFYEHYHKEAGEYDKEFIKKHDDDLGNTLIFAGLLSAVTSAFIIEIKSELQPDPNEDAAALLRFLVYKLENTSVGDIPTLPQPWPGPPRTIVHVQAILLASLAVSLFSAFLAMLGKQWLNRYASIDMRGSAIERSQHRQQKLDGIVSWYFEHVMESLPSMLQVALLLLGGALSRYFWDISKTVASVIVGVTSFGALFYLFIVVGGVASTSFPYQTPAAHILRHIPHILDVLRSVIVPWIKTSICYATFTDILSEYKKGKFLSSTIVLLCISPLLPSAFLADVLDIMTFAISGAIRFVRSDFRTEQQSTVLDLHSISWTLRMSLDGPVRLSALNLLATMTLPDFDPTLVTNCFNVLFGCVKTTNGRVVINQGSEKLAEMSALCFLHALSNIKATYPLSRSLEGIRWRYARAFPSETNFDNLPFSHTLGVIHRVFYPTHPGRTYYLDTIGESLYTWSVGGVQQVRWENYAPSSDEHVIVACALTRLALFENWRRRGAKVPRWLLCFALHFLSQDTPLPPTSVVVSCLTIVAIDLDCHVPETMTSDNSGRMEEVSKLITRKLETMATDRGLIHDKRKAIITLFLYAVRLGRSGNQRIVDASLRAAMALNSKQPVWGRAKPLIMKLSNTQGSPSLNWLIALEPPWHDEPYDENMVTRRVGAVAAVITALQSMVYALLTTVPIDSLRPYIPIGIWAWLKKRVSPLPKCSVRSRVSSGDVVRRVRALGDVDILKSYLLLIWSEWDPIDDQQPGGLAEMEVSIREDFGGIEMWRHRQDLIKRLDHILGQLDMGLDHLQQHKSSLDTDHIPLAKAQYSELEEVLLEVDVEAMDTLAQYHWTFVCALPPP